MEFWTPFSKKVGVSNSKKRKIRVFDSKTKFHGVSDSFDKTSLKKRLEFLTPKKNIGVVDSKIKFHGVSDSLGKRALVQTHLHNYNNKKKKMLNPSFAACGWWQYFEPSWDQRASLVVAEFQTSICSRKSVTKKISRVEGSTRVLDSLKFFSSFCWPTNSGHY